MTKHEYDPVATKSVRQYGGSEPVDMRICSECGHEYNALRGPCEHLWYVSGNKGKGDVFAVPVSEVEEGAVILTDDIARLKDSNIDGARRWVVVAESGEKAVEKLARFCLNDPEEALPALAADLGIPYDTLARYAREGRILARKSGGVWLSTKRAIEAAGIKPRRAVTDA